MNNKPVFPDCTPASLRASCDILGQNCSVKRLRQAFWRWDRSEGDTDKPTRRFFRNPPPYRAIVQL